MNQRFQNKVVLVSGTSSGIGEKVAITFAEQGAKIILSSRNADLNLDLVRRIKKNGGEALFIKADFSKPRDIQYVVKVGV